MHSEDAPSADGGSKYNTRKCALSKSGGAEFIWTIWFFLCFFSEFPIVIALKQLCKAKTSVLILCPFPLMKSRRNTHQSILQPLIDLEMSFCKFIFNSFLPELPKSLSVSCFNHWKSNVQVCMHTLQKQVGCFNHRVVTLVADKLERQWLWDVCFVIRD